MRIPKIILLITMTLSCTLAQASMLFEPYLGYEIGDQEQGTTSYDTNGINLGFRAGLTHEPFFFGLEYSLADLSVDRPGGDSGVKTSDWGPFIGASVSVVRLWLTYWISSEGNSDNPNSDYKGGGGYKLGLGFNIFSQVHFNVEKTLRKWNKSNGQSISRIEMDGMMISLSLPFTF